jgi:PAS domain S-box-containing protein
MSPYLERRSFLIPVLIPFLAAEFVIIAGATVLYSWYANGSIPTGALTETALIKPNAGIGLILAGLALSLQLVPPEASRWIRLSARPVAYLFAIAVTLLGVLPLVQDLSGFDLQIDRHLLFAHTDLPQSSSGRMAPLTAWCTALAGLCLLLLDYRNDKGQYPAEYGAIVMAGIMGLPLIGYLYSSVGLVQIASLAGIAPLTPVIFFVMAIGILTARPTHPLVSLWNSDAPGGHLVRRLLPASLLLLTLLNLLAEWGERQGFYERDKVSPLAVLLGSAVLFILFCRAAAMLNREHGVRRQGEAALSERNALLRAVSDNTPDAIFVRDRQGRMIFANPAMLRMLGKDAASVIGCTSAEIYVDPQDARTVDEQDRKIMANGRAQVLEETVNFSHGLRTFHSTKAPWLDDHGNVLGLVGISTDITDRKRIEDALRAHETQLEELVAARTAEVSELVGHIETTREEEKRAIARELHDDLGSAFTALNMHLEILFRQIPTDPALTERAVQVKALLKSVIDATRRIQIGLRPDKLDIFGIKVAIAEQALEFEKYTGVTCRADLPDEELSYTPQQDIALFRIVQEALNNIAKHAKATHVDIILDETDDTIILTVRDNGIGIAPGRTNTPTRHGLRGMRERAGYLGGQVRITSRKEKGTTISVMLPITRVPHSNNQQVVRQLHFSSYKADTRTQLFQ